MHDAKKTTLLAGMAARPVRIREIEHGVGVAIGPDFGHVQDVSAGLTLAPQRTPRAAIEVSLPGIERGAQGLLIRVCQHPDFSRHAVLYDHRDQAVVIVLELLE